MAVQIVVPKWLFNLLIIVVGVLLVTMIAFIMTIRTAQPTAMKLYVPKEEKPETEHVVKASGALTLLLAKNGVIFFYEGELKKDASNLHSCDLKDIGKVILQKKQTTNEKDFVVVIKPSEESTYKNTVDVLDQMTVNDVKRYAMVDISPVEKDIINKK